MREIEKIQSDDNDVDGNNLWWWWWDYSIWEKLIKDDISCV